MDRKEFLSAMGLGAMALACGSCLSGCGTNDNPVEAPANVDVTLDLNSNAYVALKTNGGYAYSGSVIIAKTADGSYTAVSKVCTHQGNTIIFDAAANQFMCPAHGSLYAIDGTVVQGPAARDLARYNVTLSGNSLHIFS